MKKDKASQQVILGIESATDNCSVGLYGSNFKAEISESGKQKHAEMLIPMIEKILRKTNLNPKDLNGIAVSIGPGSFTGLRIGLSTAKGLAEGLSIKLIPVMTMESLLKTANIKQERVTTVVHSHKKLIYFQRWEYSAGAYQAIGKTEMVTIDELLNQDAANGRIIGADSKILKFYEIQLVKLSGLTIARLGYERFEKYKDFDYSRLEPKYFSQFKALKWKEYEQSRKRLEELRERAKYL